MEFAKKINLFRFSSLTGTLLLLTFLISFTACAESDQEIGVPYFDSRNSKGNFDQQATAGKVDGAALAPSGEKLYTLKDGVLSQYWLSPLRRIKSVDVNFDTAQTKENQYRPFVTNNESKIVIYSKTSLRLLDIESGEIIKTITFNSGLGVMNGSEFLTLDNKGVGVVWEASKLIKKREFYAVNIASQDNTQAHLVDISYGTLIKAENHIVLYRPGHGGVVVVLDDESYRNVWSVKHKESQLAAISYDLNTLYIPNSYSGLWHSGEYVNFVQENSKKINNYSSEGILKIVLPEKKWIIIDRKDFKKKHHYSLFRLYVPLWGNGQWREVSPTHKYYIAMGADRRSYVTFQYPKEKIKQAKYFLQFDDGEAALFGAKTNYFQLTKNAKKHVKMKNDAGIIVPMNKVTFREYYKSDDHKEW